MTARLLWVGVVLAGCAAALLWLREPEARNLQGTHSSSEPNARGAGTETLAVAASATGRYPAAGSTALDPEDSIPLKVVDFATGRPAPEAEIFSIE